MLGEGGTALAELEDAIRRFHAREDNRVDLKGLRKVIDVLKVELATEEHASQLHSHCPVDPDAS
jgi:prolyl-tRNA editing enzyme YbaK/EbsC (Cys-tRNA(Pro) deacylase)